MIDVNGQFVVPLIVRSLVIAAVGGLRSVTAALAAATVFAMLESALIAGVFGTVGAGGQELILSGALLALTLVVASRSRTNAFTLGRAEHL